MIEWKTKWYTTSNSTFANLECQNTLGNIHRLQESPVQCCSNGTSCFVKLSGFLEFCQRCKRWLPFVWFVFGNSCIPTDSWKSHWLSPNSTNEYIGWGQVWWGTVETKTWSTNCYHPMSIVGPVFSTEMKGCCQVWSYIHLTHIYI